MDADGAVALVKRIYRRLSARRADVRKLENYYDGSQPLTFATEAWRKANAERYSGFSDNWCGTVVNAEAERLQPIGLSNLPKRGASMLWDQLQMNEFDAQFSQAAVTTLTARRSFVIVWRDSDGESLISFEHPSFVEVEYDWENPRKRTAALKTWLDDDTEYATLYTPDNVWKFSRPRPTTANDMDSQAVQWSTPESSEAAKLHYSMASRPETRCERAFKESSRHGRTTCAASATNTCAASQRAKHGPGHRPGTAAGNDTGPGAAFIRGA